MLQMIPDATNQATNLRKADLFCREAKKRGADIALMPEMWNIGYTAYQGGEEAMKAWQAQAVSRESEFVQHFSELAEDLDMAIVVTYLEEWDGAPRNSLTLFDRHGEEALTYSKVHTCDFANFEAATAPGEDFYVETIDTASGPVEIGAMICYDREFPESARILMLKGAEVVLTPNACLLDDIRLAQFGTRALENSMAMVMTNYPAPLHGGRSVAYNLDGSQNVLAPAEEGIWIATYDLEQIRDYRKRSIWGDAFRRPHRYKALLGNEKDPIFERLNAFGKPFVGAER
ncbi:MAG: carbon-nitrogen hydrolase family protein [Candidatus Omnitrophica bacterium]|nr:carbon-nitrogen hydrolase family protein [Candidatus Omnitrophota bacterium]